MLERKHAMIASDMEEEQRAMPDLDSAPDDAIGEDIPDIILGNRYFLAC